MKMVWEKIASNWPLKEGETHPCVRRSKVPGGWLVFVYGYDYESEQEMYEGPQGSLMSGGAGSFGFGFGGLTFLPDPEHVWDGNSL